MTSAPIPLCESCAFLAPGPDGFGHVCDAFPDGIPDPIYMGGADHREPFDGDGGVRFKLDPTDPSAAERLAAYEQSIAPTGS